VSGQSSKGLAMREAIRRTAAAQFQRHGYSTATLGDIASALGVTRPAILYHFTSKQELLEAVTGPYLDALDEVAERWRQRDRTDEAARSELLAGFVDASASEALAAGTLFRDPTTYAQATIRDRLADFSLLLRDALAGPDATLQGRTLANCIVGAVIRPMLDTSLDPTDPRVRGAILDATFALCALIDSDARQEPVSPGR
jgi:AcrR family transcriptional regulator